MSPARNQSTLVVYDSGDDSDIQEISVIPASSSGIRAHSNREDGSPGRRSSPILKRRKSSPQMDPIPTYTPTPLHILEQRARVASGGPGSSSFGVDDYYPAQVAYNPSPISSTHHDNCLHSSSSDRPRSTSNSRSHNDADDYIPLLHPDPHVIGCETTTTTTNNNDQSPPTNHGHATRLASRRTPPPPQASGGVARPAHQRSVTSSSSTPRPVSSALAQAVSRRRNSLAQQEQEKTLSLAAATKSATAYREAVPTSAEYAQKPVMWSPKVPSEIERLQDEQEENEKRNVTPISTEDYGKYQSVRPQKQRVAHKPTIPKNKQNRPRVPLGTSKKVPIAFRAKYLDVIINEYLNTGHKEQESYQEALNDEKALADRASSKNIYVNLVAGLKKKIREKAGISTLPQDEDPKFVNGNKVVSHEQILTGKVKGTFSIERKRKLSDPSELSEQDLYDRLSRYVMPQDDLISYGYPHRDPDQPELSRAPLGKDGQKMKLKSELSSSYTCERCAKVYRIGEDGMPLPTTSKCIFHPGHLWNERINRALEKRYSCCKGDPSAGGCSSNVYHVHKGELELEKYSGYVETQLKPERDPNKHGLYALDCEMCYTTYGLELTRVTVINYKHEVVYERLVKPKNPILDYNTKFSGIKPGDLDDIDTTLADVQLDLMRLFSSQTILVGHSLDSDMRALKIFHKRFIDTAQLFPHKRGLPYKRALRTLMVENLRVIIQEDSGHDSKEDACAAFRLVMWKAKTDVPVKAS